MHIYKKMSFNFFVLQSFTFNSVCYFIFVKSFVKFTSEFRVQSFKVSKISTPVFFFLSILTWKYLSNTFVQIHASSITGLFSHVVLEQLSLVHQILYSHKSSWSPDTHSHKHTSQWRFLIRPMLCYWTVQPWSSSYFPIIDCLTSCNNKQSNCSGWNIGGYRGFLFSFSHAVFVWSLTYGEISSTNI